MKIKALIYTLIVAPLLLTSCAKEDYSNEPAIVIEKNSRLITLQTNLPSSNSRGVSVDHLEECVVTIFNANNPHREPGQADGAFNPWHDTKVFTAQEESFTNEEVIWPEKDSEETGNDYGGQPLLFYAHYPNLEAAFPPVNNSTYTSPTDFSVDYSLGNFTVDGDISKHIDFMTAYAEAAIPEGAKDTQSIKLDFHHQLSAIEIKAKGENMAYNIEIAGVMIGNVIDKGNFRFQSEYNAQGTLTTYGSWSTGNWNDDMTEIIRSRNSVKYIHKNAEEHVVSGNDSPATLMGNGGRAMIIPFRANAWDNKNDAKNKNNGTYFGVLIHVTDKKGNQIYPYPSEDLKPEGYQNGLRIAQTIDGKQYGWAAIPIKLNLQNGKRYSYTLDFSKGLGVLPPDDKDPGKPIVANDHIEISLSVYDWVKEEISITPDFGGDQNGTTEGEDNKEGEGTQNGSDDNEENNSDANGNGESEN